ncbi:shikimate dehydrogenase family protein [Latilactobacillus sakei]|uniref:shikimate dehydrogenase family protein n=1 Tax=Latilactobacillus sakei TaxID=1599 RepID=UPI0030820280
MCLAKGTSQRRYRSVTILGAGGAALAVIEAAVRYGVQQVTVFKRANATYDSVIQRLAQISLASGLQIIVEPYDDQLALATALQNADCLINATNIGMTATPGNPLPINLLQYLPEDSLVADLIYAPRETAFLKTAQKAHYQIQNGLGMLIEQAALSFEFWTNESMATMPIYQHLTGGNDAS